MGNDGGTDEFEHPSSRETKPAPSFHCNSITSDTTHHFTHGYWSCDESSLCGDPLGTILQCRVPCVKREGNRSQARLEHDLLKILSKIPSVRDKATLQGTI